ncbi:MAG: hypothetical protein HGA23_03570 [Bacteroidales bacterium]|nr:hypothetical protein [Bacteroidales bacterium]
MKTTTNNNRACKMATAICAAFVFGTSLLAQPNPETNKFNEVNEAVDRLEALISQAEQAARYVAPSVDYDDIRPAMERLELLANKTISEIRYKAPGEEQTPAEEYTAKEDNTNASNEDFLTFYNRTKKARK